MAPATAVLRVQFDRIGGRQYNNAIVTMIDVGLEELRVLIGTEAVAEPFEVVPEFQFLKQHGVE